MKFSREPLSVAATCNGLVFVGLNLADAWLTGRLLALGGQEVLWWAAPFNSNMLVKTLLALGIVLLLVVLGKAKLLWLLNIGISVVLFSNLACFLSYLAGLYGWFQ